MPTEGTEDKAATAPLLAANEPPPFKVLNPEATTPVLLVCDHASDVFPASLGTLGLDPPARRCHLAIDIGAGRLTEHLAASLGVTTVLCGYSRLVVDCNRQLMDPGAFLEFGDGMIIPGNRNLHVEDKQRRADAIYWPYHNAIDAEIERLGGAFGPIIISIHSFTPVLNGESRAWEMGILWDADPVTAEIFIHDLRAAGYLVGDNEPYSGKAPQDFTLDHHAEARNLPHVGIEIRQDLIHHEEGVEPVAKAIHDVISTLPGRLQPTRIDKNQPKATA